MQLGSCELFRRRLMDVAESGTTPRTLGWAGDVMTCSTANVVEMLLSRPRMLSDDEARQLAVELDAALGTTTREAAVGKPWVPVEAVSSRGPRSRPGSRRSKSGWSDGVKALIVLGAAWILLTQPAILGGVADVLRGWFTEGLSQHEDPPEPGRVSEPTGHTTPTPQPIHALPRHRNG